MTTNRHTKATWINAGLSALKTDTAQALRAEPLAKQLGTTKGSFYWHFADVPTFQRAVVEHWRTTVLTEIVAQLSRDETAENRLRLFGEHILSDKIDPAMRAWAKSFPPAAEALRQVDDQRLTYISTLLSSLGIANPAFASACYSALIGSAHIKTSIPPSDAYTALIDLVLALQ